MPERSRRFVLVTGADSGIGRALVARLTHSGFHVLAACYADTIIWDLPAASHERLRRLQLDVTCDASCQAAADHAEQIVGSEGLYALVNNAGIALGGPQEIIDRDCWYQQFQVNVFGTAAITRALLPLLRIAPGARIVNMGSICSLVSYPFVAPYCASKHAIDAMTMSLRGELRPWGLQATLIAPGLVNTELWERADETACRQLATYTPQQREWYGARIERRLARTMKRARRGLSPEAVAQVVADVMHRRRLRARYFVGRDAKWLYWADRVVPRRVGGNVLRRRLGLPS